MALSAYDTTLTVNGNTIGEITNISVGGSSLTEIDITNLTSTDKEYIMGALEAGTLTIDFFAPANWSGFDSTIVPASGDSVAAAFVITFAGGSLDASFNGICTNLSISAEQDGAVTASATVKLTSAITWS
jgi:hypothetical protein